MATTVKLVMDFTATGKDSVRVSLNYADPDVTVAKVKTLGTAIIATAPYVTYPYTALKAAKLVTTTEGDFDLSE